jgi:hypothetical protein
LKSTLIKALPTSWYLYLRWYNLRLTDAEATGGYLPFDKSQSIFVHIPKCAGISVNKTLFNSLAGGHTTLDQYINVFPPALFQSYFKFTFVRNPWDRVVSAYSFLQNGGLNKWDNDFYEKELKQYKSFKDFVEGWLNQENILKFHHFKPQHLYFIDKYNKVSVDFIGYFEHIEEDFCIIAEKVGCKNALTKRNAVSRDDYRSYYDQDTIKIVADVYKKDIQLLNYEFDSIPCPVRTLDPTAIS